MTQAYQKAFRHLFDGSVEQYDPWDAAYRTAGPQYPGTTMCSAFRTFQGWTALSDMDHDQGVLHTVPIPEAMDRLAARGERREQLCGGRRSRWRSGFRHHSHSRACVLPAPTTPAAATASEPARSAGSSVPAAPAGCAPSADYVPRRHQFEQPPGRRAAQPGGTSPANATAHRHPAPAPRAAPARAAEADKSRSRTVRPGSAAVPARRATRARATHPRSRPARDRRRVGGVS